MRSTSDSQQTYFQSRDRLIFCGAVMSAVGFLLFHCLFSASAEVGDELAVKAHSTYHDSHSPSFRHHCLRSLPQACKCQDMENTVRSGSVIYFFSTCTFSPVRRGPGTDIRHTYLTAGLLYLQIATYESLMDVCDCIVNN